MGRGTCNSGFDGQLGMVIIMSGYSAENGRGGGIEDFYYNKMARTQYPDQNYDCLILFKLNSINPVYPTYINNNFFTLKTTSSLFCQLCLAFW